MDTVNITRASYQAKRLEFLRGVIEVERLRGLEIGACDLPTVPSEVGICEFADFRSSEEMIGMWNLPPETVMPVKYIVTRDKRMDEQIKDRFDYIISCHVIEHVPNPIGYILELRNLLNPDGPGIIFIAAPDKRCTHDLARPTTSLEHLLSDYFEDARYPSIEHILEFRKHWVPGEDIPIVERYGFAVNNFNSGRADVHCHVWSDHEFFDQINQLCVGRILENMGVAKSQGTLPGYNEFTICLVALKDASK